MNISFLVPYVMLCIIFFKNHKLHYYFWLSCIKWRNVPVHREPVLQNLFRAEEAAPWWMQEQALLLFELCICLWNLSFSGHINTTSEHGTRQRSFLLFLQERVKQYDSSWSWNMSCEFLWSLDQVVSLLWCSPTATLQLGGKGIL